MSAASHELQPFLTTFETALAAGTLVALVISGGSADGVSRFDVRPVLLQGELHLQWTSQQGRQARHENLSPEASISRLRDLLGASFRNAQLRTSTADWQARWSKRGRLLLSQQDVARQGPSLDHNRTPQHLIAEGTPCPFLHEIGVMTATGQVRAPQQHKFRQINRYLEFVRDILPELPAEGPIEVVDCGCGKSGLTFALQHYLTVHCGREVHLVGLDWNADVLRTCEGIAGRLGLRGIEFRAGDIASYQPPGPVHLVVSLHACDTATDAALARSVGWDARFILAVPCCQHELSPQLRSEPLESLLAHGILRERFAADVTDSLRATLLEAAGYRTQVLQFIELEHTPKNLLLRAVRRTDDAMATRIASLSRFGQLKSLLGFQHFALETMLSHRLLQVLRATAPPP